MSSQHIAQKHVTPVVKAMPLSTHRRGSRETSSGHSSPSRASDPPPCHAASHSQTENSQAQSDESQERNSSSHVQSHVQERSHTVPERPSSAHVTPDRPALSHCHHKTNWVAGEKVTLLVEGKRFSVSPLLFTKQSNTMLGRMFSTPMDVKPNEHGEYEVAKGVPASIFRAIMEFYRSGVVHCPSSESVSELREACDYLLIPFNEKTIKTQNLCDFLNELSNDGAKMQFENYLKESLFPAMVLCAKKGDRECQAVILTEDDVIEWDEEYPPSVGEDHIQRVVSSDLYRFFKYFENRDIAKEVLREKGLKKIRIGMEGYPTSKEKVRVRQNTGRTEVVYNYIQRPFVRVSWEKDESKSRHVDFTTVKIKTDIAPDAEGATLLSGQEDNFEY